MRFVEKNSKKAREPDSAASSVRSVDSYEIFGSACSDYTDCEYCEDRRRRYKKPGNTQKYWSPSITSHSYCSAMSRAEAEPLLQGAVTPTYRAVSSESIDSLGPAELSSNDVLTTFHNTFENTFKPERVKKQSSLVTIFSVWNTIMGSSLLTMAWGVERAGLPAALLLLAFMAALCLYTAYVLLKVNKHHGSASCEVPALCRELLGPWAEVVAHVFSVLVLLGANIVYWILISNFLYFTVNYFIDLSSSNVTQYNTSLLCPRHANQSLLLVEPEEDSPYWGLHTTVPVYVALLVFPLLNFKDVSFFTKFNSLGTLSVAYLLIFVLVKGYAWGINIGSMMTETHALRNAAVLSGMLALSFYIHNIIITIMGNNARQENNGRDLTIAFLLVTITYTLVGAVFYICFPLAKSCIEDNLLNNFEMHDVMTALARILLLFQVITVYPLVAFMLRTEAILLLPFEKSRLLTITINLSIMTLCILVACFCPSIGTIIRYTGAVSGLVHIFALPSLLQIRSLQLRGKLTWWKTVFYCAILVFGAVNLLMQFFINE
ncbi:sodium-coupled neutral amino acid transporter 9 homolog isoform X1 [Spodoptera litura]|uniref:Sodium-coupled neutral amino acid transporter 9 homolog isoform X1 n=2 Tax=Spodoptera litura TaxID=69820 RepID=A0A9J7IRJ8_SPOLT|nr:sodium-coupled neutral amino acid transporter 9 homolog isoform X1 [Spodoptera litura]